MIEPIIQFCFGALWALFFYSTCHAVYFILLNGIPMWQDPTWGMDSEDWIFVLMWTFTSILIGCMLIYLILL